MKVSDLKGKPPKVLLWGPLGTGKTALSLTLGPWAQLIQTEEGAITGVTLEDKFSTLRRLVDVQQFLDDDPNTTTAFSRVKSYIYSLPGKIKTGEYKFLALILDSLTTLSDASMKQILRNSGVKGNPQIQHWGLSFGEIKNVMNVLYSLPIGVVVIGHDQLKETETKNWIDIAIEGRNMPSQVSRYFDEIWYANVRNRSQGKVEYTIQTQSNSLIKVRTRYQVKDGTDMNLGLWEIFNQMGWYPKEVQDEIGKYLPQGK